MSPSLAQAEVIEPYYCADAVTLYLGDCIEVMRALPEASVDAVVCDPPYGLEFMGKEWDSFPVKDLRGSRLTGSGNVTEANGFAGGVAYGKSHASMREFQQWCEAWAREAYRVLKPGGHLAAFGGTRTHHRLVCGIEDAGFEIRDELDYMYGSGFPKSRDISKDIDKLAPRAGQFEPFAAHYAERRKAAGLTHAQVCAAVGAHGEVNHGGASVNWESGYNVPTLAYWQALQPLLGLSDEWMPLIERIEAEREVIGEANVPVGHAFAGAVYGGDSSSQIVDVTAPATEDAQRWQGWGTALKPAHEPICLARKPHTGTIAANVLRHGTGALNIDGTRIDMGDEYDPSKMQRQSAESVSGFRMADSAIGRETPTYKPGGRWPANVLLDEEAAALLDATVGNKGGSGPASGPTLTGESSSVARGRFNGVEATPFYGDRGGPSRFFKVAKWTTDDVSDAELFSRLQSEPDDSAPSTAPTVPASDQQATHGRDSTGNSERSTQHLSHASSAEQPVSTGTIPTTTSYCGSCGSALHATDAPINSASEARAADDSAPEQATRFLYTAKASRSEREAGLEDLPPALRTDGRPPEGPGADNPRLRVTERHNDHPTVKPIAVMRWLVRLVTPPGGTVLDPFLGSGTTALAALDERMRFVGIDITERYVEIARYRLSHRHLLEVETRPASQDRPQGLLL